MAKKKVLSPYQKHKAAKAAKTKANLAETAAYQKKKQAGSLKGRLKKAVSAVSEGVSRRRAKRLAKKGKVSLKGQKVESGAYTKGAMKRKAKSTRIKKKRAKAMRKRKSFGLKPGK